MSEYPSIILSSLDWERLDTLLHSPRYARLPGVDALLSELERATVVEPKEIPADVVTMNANVRFIDDQTQAQFELSLVYPDHADEPGSVSVFAPVGSALLGLSVGQSIDWQVPGGRRLKLRVLEVLRQPEAEGEFHR